MRRGASEEATLKVWSRLTDKQVRQKSRQLANPSCHHASPCLPVFKLRAQSALTACFNRVSPEQPNRHRFHAAYAPRRAGNAGNASAPQTQSTAAGTLSASSALLCATRKLMMLGGGPHGGTCGELSSGRMRLWPGLFCIFTSL